jgi:hypothetical protein
MAMIINGERVPDELFEEESAHAARSRPFPNKKALELIRMRKARKAESPKPARASCTFMSV